jgi:hypothetical protein
MHEFGHSLQEHYGGMMWFYLNVTPSSFLRFVTREDDKSYTHTWTEIQANTMSYYYFQCPSFWRFEFYPINKNYLSNEQKEELYFHIP